MTKLLLALTLFVTSCGVAQYQSYSTKSKRAIKDYEAARKAFSNVDPVTGARPLELVKGKLKKALDRSPEFTEASEMLVKVHLTEGNINEAIITQQTVIQNKKHPKSSDYYYLAEMNYNIGEYRACLSALDRFFQMPNRNQYFERFGDKMTKSCKFALKAIKNPVPFQPKNLGPGVNTSRPEYFPTLTADDKTLLFTRLVLDKRTMDGVQEDFFVSKATGERWSEGLGISNKINTEFNEGAPSLSADGKYLIFVGCDLYKARDYGPDREGMGSCDLFVSEKNGDSWTKGFNLGRPVNSGYWESQPSFSSDGKTLYFIRRTAREENGTKVLEQDIYISEVMPSGAWSKPKRLSNVINTPGREESVQIHPDGQTLYFSSDGHVGMGGLDLFMSRKDPNGNWTKPVNLGYPINTHNDENSVLVSAAGELAYFASDRDGGFGDLDLYSFTMPNHARPIKTTHIKGRVFDVETKAPLAANFQLFDLQTNKLFKKAQANVGSGEFLVAMPENKEFALTAKHKGYSFYSEHFSIEDLERTTDGFEIDVPMIPLKPGTKWEIKNVFFDVDKFDLKPKSIVVLNEMIAFMTKNPEVKIEIGGHTDSDGDDAHNQQLSENRAKAVMNYLVENGVAASKLKAVGYGESQPVMVNDTAENKAKNRRIEAKIIQ